MSFLFRFSHGSKMAKCRFGGVEGVCSLHSVYSEVYNCRPTQLFHTEWKALLVTWHHTHHFGIPLKRRGAPGLGIWTSHEVYDSVLDGKFCGCSASRWRLWKPVTQSWLLWFHCRSASGNVALFQLASLSFLWKEFDDEQHWCMGIALSTVPVIGQQLLITDCSLHIGQRDALGASLVWWWFPFAPWNTTKKWERNRKTYQSCPKLWNNAPSRVFC